MTAGLPGDSSLGSGQACQGCRLHWGPAEYPVTGVAGSVALIFTYP